MKYKVIDKDLFLYGKIVERVTDFETVYNFTRWALFKDEKRGIFFLMKPALKKLITGVAFYEKISYISVFKLFTLCPNTTSITYFLSSNLS